MQLRDTGAPEPPPLDEPIRPAYRWYHKLGAVAASVFAFELGVVLLIFPWLTEWDLNVSFLPIWFHELWTNSYFRGAVSGLGLLNIYISVVEVFRLRRFSA